MTKHRVLDLFSGAGGFSQGFIQEGFKVVVANDNWQPAAQTYRRNHYQTTFVEGDITDPGIKADIINKSIAAEVDIIIGGPPCKAYSMAGKRDPKDSRARLFNDYIDIVSAVKPKLVLMENVPGILTAKISDGNVVDLIKKRFDDIGYHVDFQKLNAADFGAPQFRPRIIFVAVPKGKEILFPTPTHGVGKGCKPYRTIRMAIDSLANKPDDFETSHLRPKHCQEFIDKIKATPFGKNVGEYSEAFFKPFPDEPSRTVKANNGSVFVHYSQPRTMTPRELARLQGFDDQFLFCGNKWDVFEQIGNAVPVQLSQALAKTCCKMKL